MGVRTIAKQGEEPTVKELLRLLIHLIALTDPPKHPELKASYYEIQDRATELNDKGYGK